MGVIFISYNVLHIDYRISNIIGYIFGLINSFVWNKLWTFKSNKKSFREMMSFLLVFIISYFLNLGFVIYSAEVLEINKNVCQVLGMIVYIIPGFIGNKYFTFKR